MLNQIAWWKILFTVNGRHKSKRKKNRNDWWIFASVNVKKVNEKTRKQTENLLILQRDHLQKEICTTTTRKKWKLEDPVKILCVKVIHRKEIFKKLSEFHNLLCWKSFNLHHDPFDNGTLHKKTDPVMKTQYVIFLTFFKHVRVYTSISFKSLINELRIKISHSRLN